MSSKRESVRLCLNVANSIPERGASFRSLSGLVSFIAEAEQQHAVAAQQVPAAEPDWRTVGEMVMAFHRVPAAQQQPAL